MKRRSIRPSSRFGIPSRGRRALPEAAAPSSSAHARRFAKFLAAGAVNALFGYLAFLLFIRMLKVDWLALAFTYAAGVTFNYFVFARFVFHDRIGSVSRYLASYIIAFALNFVLYRALFAWLHRPPLVQLLCIAPVAIATYLLLQGWSFSQRHSHHERT